jgi:hypothetical protein
VQCRACRRDLGEPPLDSGVDVLVGVEEGELAFVELTLDSSQPSLDGGELRRRKKLRRRQTTSVRDAPGDVEGVELEIRIERR